ncbi:MAG: AsmA family protein [Gammaproteobacteria bacterium]
MKRFLKWFFGILVFLIILLVIAAVTLPYYFDPNKYKSDIIAQIKPHMMGRDLKIPGKIKLSVFPWLGVDIGKTVIGNADGFVLKPFMTINHARVHIRLLSLLSDTPEIGSIDFDGVVVNLQRDAEGRNNWSDLIKQAANTGKPTLHDAAFIKTADRHVTIPRLKIEGVHFKNATINFQDNLNKNDITVSKLNLDAGPINQYQPIPLRGNFNYASKTQGLLAASAFATTLHINQKTRVLDLKQLGINTNLAGKVLNNKTMATALTVPDLQIDPVRQRIDARQFHLTLDKMQSDGHMTLRKFSHPIIRFGLDMDTLDLDSLLPASQPAKAVAPIPTTTGTAADSSPAIFAALVPLKTADIQGTFNVKKLLFNKLQFDKASLTVIARSGLISAQPQASLYNGTYQGNLQINVSQKPVHVSLRQQLQHVAMGPITLALTGKESLTGMPTSRASLSARATR